MVREKLQSFRDTAGLSVEELADVLGWELAEVERLERGEEPVTLEVVEAYAQLAGMEASAFLRGEGLEASAPTLLFRGLTERELSLRELAEAEVPALLGELLRATRRLMEARELTGGTPDLRWMETLKRDAVTWGADVLEPAGALYRAARAAAAWLRAQWGLGEEPIASMHELLAQLGIATFYHRVEKPALEGVSLLEPTPAVLVLLGEEVPWWKARMTLAHELGHVLLDLPRRQGREAPALMLSPVPVRQRQGSRLRQGWSLVPAHEALEQRANAFAAALLAPEAAVRRLLGSDNPTSGESIARVGAGFGLGWTTSVNVLTDLFGLSREQRTQMLKAQDDYIWEEGAYFEADTRPPLGLYAGEVCERVLQALQAEQIDAVQARRLLGLKLSDALPHGACPPLIAADEVLQRLVMRAACERYGQGYCGGAVRRVAHGWDVELLYTAPRARKAEPVGTAHVDVNRRVTLELVSA